MQAPDDLATCRQLADVDFSLAMDFEAQKKFDECRSSLAECLENLDRVFQLHPHDWTVLLRRVMAEELLGTLADWEGKSEESLGHFERAVAQGDECLRLNPEPGVTDRLAHCRWSLAQLLHRRGDDERAKCLILANLRMLDHVPKDESNPNIVVWRTVVRLDLHQFKAGWSSAPASRPDEAAALSQLAASETDNLDAESWAELVAQSLSSSPTTIELKDNWIDVLFSRLRERITWLRRLGRTDEARRYVERMHAFARLLVARYPCQSIAHLALCQSFMQLAKNAWTIDDRADVERNWRLALDEARRAVMLDPQDARAASQVADLQKRLDLLLASKPSPRDLNGSSQTAGEAGR